MKSGGAKRVKGWPRVSGAVGAIFAATMGASSTALAQADTESERAELSEQLLQEGREAFENQRYKVAHERLSRAFQMHHSYRTACALGQVELELELFRDAAEHLDSCISRYPAEDPQQARERVLDGLRETRLHVAVFEPHVGLRNATILINGVEVGTTPLSSDLFVEPGLRRVTVRKVGYVDASAELLFPAGGTTHWDAKLVPQAREQAASPSDSHRGVYLGVGTALTAVTLVSGAALAVIAHSEQARADRAWQRASEQRTCFPASRDVDCLAAREQLDAAGDSRNTAAIALFAGAGLGVLTAAAYLLLPDEGVSPRSGRPSPPGDAAPSFRASVHPHGADATIGFHF